jgi:hydroxypyruvate isomerase
MNRHKFLKTSLLAAGALWSVKSIASSNAVEANATPFRMKFSPDFGIFPNLGGKNLEDQIKWGYDNGFRAWENTFLIKRPIEDQEKISRTIQKLGMEFGQFVGVINFDKPTFAGRDKEARDKVLADMRASVETAKRMNTKFVHNVLGKADPRLPWDFQMANAIELLKRAADIYEPHGIVMVMESMNHKINHPDMFLHNIPQAYALAKGADSPSVKILFDFYHVQVQEGNIIPTLDYAWDEIAYIQIGDTPGRNEPTSGEINFKNVLQHLHNKGYRGFVGMEHNISKPGKEGELAALNAYRSIDPQ